MKTYSLAICSVTHLLLFLGYVKTADWQRTIVFIRAETVVGEYAFLRGGISSHVRPNCVSVAAQDPCAMAIKHRIIPADQTSAYYSWSQGDSHLDWYGNETGQGTYQGSPSEGSPMMWTTSVEPGPGGPTVDVDGHGYTPINTFGPHFWMLDVDMDCSNTENGWFEFKTYITPLQGWENDLTQYDRCGGEPNRTKPYDTINHMALCGKMNVYYNGYGECSIYDIPNPGLTPPTGCGVSKIPGSQIVNGQPSALGRWPWMVVLQYGDTIGGCGGVLIYGGWALTAAHCVRTTNPAELKIRLGEQNLLIDQGNEQVIQVVNIIKHERFDNPEDQPNDNDIALLQLEQEADLSSNYVNIACLPKGYGMDDFVNDDCWAVGFGGTLGTSDQYRLNEAQVPVWTHANCKAAWGERVTQRQVCMGTDTKSACGGDSGSPLVCKKNEKWVLVGVTSWGSSECQGMPSVYTRITAFLDWIAYHTGIPTCYHNTVY